MNLWLDHYLPWLIIVVVGNLAASGLATLLRRVWWRLVLLPRSGRASRQPLHYYPIKPLDQGEGEPHNTLEE